MRERRRQIQQEGWTDEGDDTYVNDELAWAAVCYAAPQRVFTLNRGVTPDDPEIAFHDPWPRNFDPAFDKRPNLKRKPAIRTRIRALEKAGALIAAEIDRLQRLRASQAEASDESEEPLS